MRIKKRLRINIVVSVITAIILLVVLSTALLRVSRAMEQSRIAEELITYSFERNTLRSDYLRTGSERAKRQWYAKQEQVNRLLILAAKEFRNAEDRRIIYELIHIHASGSKIFSAIVENREDAGPFSDSIDLSPQIEDRLLTQLDMKSYRRVLLVRRLLESSRESLLSTFQFAGAGIAGALIILIAVSLVNSWIMGRTITYRILRLCNGAKVIGGGDLDYRIDMKGNDEFADLSGAFNDMAAKLSGSYRDLKEEIAVRKHAEEDRERLLKQTENDKQRLEILTNTLEERVAKRTEQVTALSKALTLAEQRERARFSHVLHEDLQQILLAAKARLDILDTEKLRDKEVMDDISEIDRLTAKALGTSKALALEMNPPILKSEGLDAALKWLAHHMAQRYDISIETDIPAKLTIVEEELGVLVIQMVREILFAAIKKAPGSRVILRASLVEHALKVDLENRNTALADTWVSREEFADIMERLKLFGGRIEAIMEPGKVNTIRIVLPVG